MGKARLDSKVYPLILPINVAPSGHRRSRDWLSSVFCPTTPLRELGSLECAKGGARVRREVTGHDSVGHRRPRVAPWISPLVPSTELSTRYKIQDREWRPRTRSPYEERCWRPSCFGSRDGHHWPSSHKDVPRRIMGGLPLTILAASPAGT